MAENKYNIKLMDPSLSPWAPVSDKSKRIACMMSGGVDSSVTAKLLTEAGFDVVGITMKIPVACDNSPRGCCGADAAFVCDQLGLPHYFVDVTEAFDELIIKPFRKAYSLGQTPNPCADCNTYLKFSLVWDYLEKELGVENVATGHYARVVTEHGQTRLKRGKDKAKDQSYFLYGTRADKLDKLHLPLGELTKKEVRRKAAELKLIVAEKPESMELCFAGESDYRQALSSDQANNQGDLIDMAGNVIGTHKGISNYTLGQRRGLGFAGGVPLYVGKIDPINNTVALGTREEVCVSTIKAEDINILIPEELKTGEHVFAKIRSYNDPKPCTITAVEDGAIEVDFAEPQFAASPGQKLVLYDADDNIIAGGSII
jgi:tRNA-specific 2-thiouridylase